MATSELSHPDVPGHRRSDGASRPRERLLARLAAAGQLAAGVAHDMTNAVTVIRLYADLLAETPGLGAAGRQHLQRIRAEAARATALAWEVLDVAHRSPPELAEADLVACVETFTDVARRLLPPGVSVRHEHEQATVPVLVDVSRLHQALVNLTGNARQAVGRDGEVVFGTDRVTVGAGRPPPLPGMIPGDWGRLRVSDTGSGIAPDVLPHVFEPFFSTKPPGAGSGLGLSQVRALVEEHDGHVQIASAPGAGTTVTLWLPVVGDGPHDQHSGGWPVERGRGELVAVVDPDPDVRRAAALVIQGLGYRTVVAADGEEVPGLIDSAGGVRAVVAAVAMPGLGGEGLARRLADIHPGVPVILAGRAPDDSTGTELRLRKPFSRLQVASVLRAALAAP